MMRLGRVGEEEEMEANLKAHTAGEHKERRNNSCAEKNTGDGLVSSPTLDTPLLVSAPFNSL